MPLALPRVAHPAEIHDATCTGCYCTAPELKARRVECAKCGGFLINNVGGVLRHNDDGTHTHTKD